jgi:hypothetical protein
MMAHRKIANRDRAPIRINRRYERVALVRCVGIVFSMKAKGKKVAMIVVKQALFPDFEWVRR